jgi:L-ectoine synthase
MLVKRKQDLIGTDRHVKTHAYETVRFLLEPDYVGQNIAGVTLTDIMLEPGIEETYGYEDHIEVAYCLEGHAVLTDLSDGSVHEIFPGTLWVATNHEKFKFMASVKTRLICAFTPPFAGHETGFVGDQT